jgi:hypothetical protein
LDHLRDCLDIADMASMADMLSYGDTVVELSGTMKEAGYRLCGALRETKMAPQPGGTAFSFAVIYVAAAPEGQPISKMAVPRRVI